MPLFEYTCRGCGHRFETLVTANRTPACPACASSDLEKQFSTFGTRSAGAGSRPATSRFT
jgi:putative FmdB family regulatory protein